MPNIKSTRKTVGLALGSGAYRGFAHIGVLKSLIKNNITIDYLSGCSIGAWVAAYYALFEDLQKIKKDLINNQKEAISLFFDFDWSGGLIGGKKLIAYLEKNLQNCNFSDLKIPLKIVATDMSNGQPFIFDQGKVAQAVRASTSVPLIFKPFSYQGKLLIDGGLCNPVPGNLVREMGADIVIGVNLYNKNEFLVEKVNMPNVLNRIKKIILYNLSQASIPSCDVVIEPDISRFIKKSSLTKYFTKEVAEEIILIGERATDRVIPLIKSKLKL